MSPVSEVITLLRSALAGQPPPRVPMALEGERAAFASSSGSARLVGVETHRRWASDNSPSRSSTGSRHQHAPELQGLALKPPAFTK